jgi:hypothetical protein
VSEDQPDYKVEPTESPEPAVNELTIYVGEFLFEFRSYQTWVNKAQSWFRNCGHRSDDCICIDAMGRIVSIGLHFRRAEQEDAFPVKVYLKHV